MTGKLVVKGQSRDVALLRACYARLNLDWQVDPWTERHVRTWAEETRPQIAERPCSPGKVLAFTRARVL
jgi:hypothetical protein